MIVNIHNAEGKRILTIVDDNLIGQKISENGLQLDLSSDFYKGEKRTEEEIEKLVPRSYIMHLVGKKSVAWGIKNNIVEKDKIIAIKNIPHAEVVFL